MGGGEEMGERSGEKRSRVEMLNQTCYFVPCYYECQINYIVLLHLISFYYIMYYMYFTFFPGNWDCFMIATWPSLENTQVYSQRIYILLSLLWRFCHYQAGPICEFVSIHGSGLRLGDCMWWWSSSRHMEWHGKRKRSCKTGQKNWPHWPL